MRYLMWPADVHIAHNAISIEAHSIGDAGRGGHYAFKRGPGARWRGQVSVPALCTPQAVALRAMFHGLRGRSGFFLFRLPLSRATQSACSHPEGKARFTDCTRFADGTTFADAWAGVMPTEAIGLATIAADSDQLTCADLSASPLWAAGAYVHVGPAFGGQLFRIVSVAGAAATVRPRARLALTSELATVGAPHSAFRLSGETPAIPLMGRRSLPFTVDIEECY